MKRPTLKSGIAFVIAFATAWNANADTVILPALGEYILTSDNARWITQREKSTVCERFTANLNEFRHIPYPAREYVLTAKGWRNSQDSCFYVGKVEVLGVVGATKVVPDPDGTPAYDVKYKIGVRKLDECTWLVINS